MITKYTTRFNIKNSYFRPPILWSSKQTAIGPLHSINGFAFFFNETACVYCAVWTESLNVIQVNFVFKYLIIRDSYEIYSSNLLLNDCSILHKAFYLLFLCGIHGLWLSVKTQHNLRCILFCTLFFSSLAITLIRARFLQPYKSCCFANNSNFLLSYFHTVKLKLDTNVHTDCGPWFPITCCELRLLLLLRPHGYKNSHKTRLLSDQRLLSS